MSPYLDLSPKLGFRILNIFCNPLKDDLFLAGRNLGFIVGIWTLVSTEVGGVFVNGTSEIVYTQGVLWALAPIGYSIRLL